MPWACTDLSCDPNGSPTASPLTMTPWVSAPGGQVGGYGRRFTTTLLPSLFPFFWSPAPTVLPMWL